MYNLLHLRNIKLWIHIIRKQKESVVIIYAHQNKSLLWIHLFLLRSIINKNKRYVLNCFPYKHSYPFHYFQYIKPIFKIVLQIFFLPKRHNSLILKEKYTTPTKDLIHTYIWCLKFFHKSLEINESGPFKLLCPN